MCSLQFHSVSELPKERNFGRELFGPDTAEQSVTVLYPLLGFAVFRDVFNIFLSRYINGLIIFCLWP